MSDDAVPDPPPSGKTPRAVFVAGGCLVVVILMVFAGAGIAMCGGAAMMAGPIVGAARAKPSPEVAALVSASRSDELDTRRAAVCSLPNVVVDLEVDLRALVLDAASRAFADPDDAVAVCAFATLRTAASSTRENRGERALSLAVERAMGRFSVEPGCRHAAPTLTAVFPKLDLTPALTKASAEGPEACRQAARDALAAAPPR